MEHPVEERVQVQQPVSLARKFLVHPSTTCLRRFRDKSLDWILVQGVVCRDLHLTCALEDLSLSVQAMHLFLLLMEYHSLLSLSICLPEIMVLKVRLRVSSRVI